MKNTEYVEVQIVPSQTFSLEDIEALPLAPGSEIEYFDNGSVRLQILAELANQLADNGAQIRILREFLLVEPLLGLNSSQSASEIACEYADEGMDVYLRSTWKYSYINYNGFPYPYTVTSIDLHYQVVVQGKVDIDLENETGSITHNLEENLFSSVNRTVTGISTFNGQPLAQAWGLRGKDYYSYTSYIDYWWIKLYYDSGIDYCSALAYLTDYEYISRVVVGSIDNSTGSTGYADYTSLSTSMNIGTSYPITVTNGKPYENDQCGIWIDWNHDNDFDDIGETITTAGAPAGPYTASITPPADAVAGDTTMRVRIVDTSEDALAPCGSVLYGETEDYTINVVSSAVQKYSGGTGTPEDPYRIATPQDMNAIGANSEDWASYFRMTADIDMSVFAPDKYNIIAPDYRYPFTGVFDGNGCTIYNFTYIKAASNVGLFGYIDDGGLIINVHLMNAQIDIGSGNGAGILACRVVDANVTGCSVSGSSIKGNQYIGGVVGYNYGRLSLCYADNIEVTGIRNVGGLVATNQSDGEIIQCLANVNVIADNYVGGLSGDNYGQISECLSKGSVLGRDGGSFANKSAGGLVGDNSKNVVNCYSNANVTGDSQVGGLCGTNASSSVVAIIENCYSTGAVNGSSNVGGLVGLDFSEPDGETINSFWDVETSGRQSSFGGTGLTTVQMKTASTYKNVNWDFVNIWRICDSTDYPKFQWEPVLIGDVACPDGVDFIDYSYFAKQWMLTKLSFDTAPDGGDGIVNFLDFADFAENWQGDYNQLYEFANQWLQRGMYNADIAPIPSSDGIVDIKDLAIFATNWLAEL
ncbi:MAG: GEVED domain-containing protein [Planctomycetaceae bacterium]|nr:GEVED domain-containing protein [Planctomycetaceae bacterium]